MKANISRRWPVIICNKTRPNQAQSYSKRSANKIVTWRPWLVPFGWHTKTLLEEIAEEIFVPDLG